MQVKRLMTIGLRKLCEAPANLGSAIVALPAVAARLDAAYERSRKTHAGRMASLRGLDARIAADLARTGVSVTSLDEFGIAGSDAVLAAADVLMAKHFPLDRSFQCGRLDILTHPEIYQWGLSERLLDIAENYLGVPVAYDGLNIFLTKADGRQAGARRWHRDVEDRRMLKVALYVHDVSSDGGPLQVITRRLPDHDRTVGGKFPILTQERLEARVSDFDCAKDVSTFTGKRGTLVFADTASLYHRGMPAIARDRCAIYFNYMHRVPLRPFRCERTPISRADVRYLVSNLSQRQQDCALWRDQLPLLGRVVPPAPIWN